MTQPRKAKSIAVRLGWDEITWFALTPEAERNGWLRYAWKWVKESGPMATCNCRVAASYRPASPMRRAGTGSTRRARRARRVSTPKTRSRNSGGRNSPRCLRPARTGIRSAGLRISSHLSPGLRQRAGVQYMPRTRDRACGRRAQRSLLITHPLVVYESDLTRLGPDWRSSGNSPPHPAWPTWTGGNLLR